MDFNQVKKRNSNNFKKQTTTATMSKNAKIYNDNSIQKNERLERINLGQITTQEPDLIKSTIQQKFNTNHNYQLNENGDKKFNNYKNEHVQTTAYNAKNKNRISRTPENSQEEISSLIGARRNYNHKTTTYNNNDNDYDDDDDNDYNTINHDENNRRAGSVLTKKLLNNGKLELNHRSKQQHTTATKTNSRNSSELRNTSSSQEKNSSSTTNELKKQNNLQKQLKKLGNDEKFSLDEKKNFMINIKIDLVSSLLFIIALLTRFYKLSKPNNVVFDEIHYGKYVSYYMKNMFFFDQHPPLGKQLIAGVAHLVGYNGNYTFKHIGEEYTTNVPIFWLRLVPAICGSLLSPVTYEILVEMRLSRWTGLLGGILIILDNSLLTQSRFILMDTMLLLFSLCGILYLLRFQRSKFATPIWIYYGALSAAFFTFGLSVKYAGFYTCALAFLIMLKYLWDMLYDSGFTDFQIFLQTITRWIIFTIIPIFIYISIFYIHLSVLYKAGPHDNVMTSAFQASLDGGLASITRGQPSRVVHGSQITLRHTHGRTCWLHSHVHVYPVKYSDKRGSSHQQQVTCYGFKDVNNWWIVKRPQRDDLVVGAEPDAIKHGEIIQLVHGITSRGLNSHDVAGPLTPTSQEVSCYIDYNVSMPAQMLWKVDIVNRKTEGSIWQAIRSEVRLIHVSTNMALRFSGKQLPDWGFHQHEIVADRDVEHQDTVWNVEEHRYTKSQDKKEREIQMLRAEMIPTKKVEMTFWQKFTELHSKMLWYNDQITSHMYSSEVTEWPLLDKGIAYYIDLESNGQIHLLGNILIWYSCTISLFIYSILLIFYLIRRRRLCYDLPEKEWQKFVRVGEIFFLGYILHYIPYFFVERTLFLHNYLPAFIFKLLLLCYVFEHINYILKDIFKIKLLVLLYKLGLLIWLAGVVYVYVRFLSVSYGIQRLTLDDVLNLRWKDTWDFIVRVHS